MAIKIKQLKCNNCSCRVAGFKEDLIDTREKCVRAESCGLLKFEATILPWRFDPEVTEVLTFPEPVEIHIRTGKDVSVITR